MMKNNIDIHKKNFFIFFKSNIDFYFYSCYNLEHEIQNKKLHKGV